MVWQKIKSEKDKDLFEFTEKGQVLQGVLVGSEKDVGKFHNTIHKIQSGDMRLWSLWGNSQLDELLDGRVGKLVRITLLDPEYKYKNGVGRLFGAEEWVD